MSNKKWYKETLHENVRVEYAIDNVLFQDKTQHQDMILFEIVFTSFEASITVNLSCSSSAIFR